MSSQSINRIIATRKLRSPDGGVVEILIGMPEKNPDDKGYFCLTQIKGLGSEKVRTTQGEDSVQALFLALQRIGALLISSDEILKREFNWLGSTAKDTFGFPISDSIADSKR